MYYVGPYRASQKMPNKPGQMVELHVPSPPLHINRIHHPTSLISQLRVKYKHYLHSALT